MKKLLSITALGLLAGTITTASFALDTTTSTEAGAGAEINVSTPIQAEQIPVRNVSPVDGSVDTSAKLDKKELINVDKYSTDMANQGMKTTTPAEGIHTNIQSSPDKD